MSYGRGGYTGSDRLPHGAPLPSSRSVSRLSLGSQQGSTRMGSSPLFNTREAGHTPFTEPPDSLPRYNNHPSHRRSSDSSQSLGFTRPNHGRASLNQGQVPHNSNFGTPAPGQRFPSQSHIVVPPNYRVQASPNLNRPTIYPHSPVTASFIPPAASMPNNRQPFPSQHDHNSAPSYGVHHNRAPQNGINYYPNSTPTRDPDVLGEERGAMRPETSHSHTAISQGPRIAALPSNDPQSLSQVHESRATPYDSMIELSWEQRKDLHNRVRFVKTLKGVVEEYRDKFHYPHHLDQYITEWGKPSYPHLDQVWLELAREYYDDLDADWLCNTTNKASASEHPGHWMAESSSTQIGLLSTWEFLKEKYKKYQSDSTAQKELSLYQYISRETQNNGRYPVTHEKQWLKEYYKDDSFNPCEPSTWRRPNRRVPSASFSFDANAKSIISHATAEPHSLSSVNPTMPANQQPQRNEVLRTLPSQGPGQMGNADAQEKATRIETVSEAWVKTTIDNRVRRYREGQTWESVEPGFRNELREQLQALDRMAAEERWLSYAEDRYNRKTLVAPDRRPE